MMLAHKRIVYLYFFFSAVLFAITFSKDKTIDDKQKENSVEHRINFLKKYLGDPTVVNGRHRFSLKSSGVKIENNSGRTKWNHLLRDLLKFKKAERRNVKAPTANLVIKSKMKETVRKGQQSSLRSVKAPRLGNPTAVDVKDEISILKKLKSAHGDADRKVNGIAKVKAARETHVGKRYREKKNQKHIKSAKSFKQRLNSGKRFTGKTHKHSEKAVDTNLVIKPKLKETVRKGKQSSLRSVEVPRLGNPTAIDVKNKISIFKKLKSAHGDADSKVYGKMKVKAARDTHVAKRYRQKKNHKRMNSAMSSKQQLNSGKRFTGKTHKHSVKAVNANLVIKPKMKETVRKVQQSSLRSVKAPRLGNPTAVDVKDDISILKKLKSAHGDADRKVNGKAKGKAARETHVAKRYRKMNGPVEEEKHQHMKSAISSKRRLNSGKLIRKKKQTGYGEDYGYEYDSSDYDSGEDYGYEDYGSDYDSGEDYGSEDYGSDYDSGEDYGYEDYGSDYDSGEDYGYEDYGSDYDSGEDYGYEDYGSDYDSGEDYGYEDYGSDYDSGEDYGSGGSAYDYGSGEDYGSGGSAYDYDSGEVYDSGGSAYDYEYGEDYGSEDYDSDYDYGSEDSGYDYGSGEVYDSEDSGYDSGSGGDYDTGYDYGSGYNDYIDEENGDGTVTNDDKDCLAGNGEGTSCNGPKPDEKDSKLHSGIEGDTCGVRTEADTRAIIRSWGRIIGGGQTDPVEHSSMVAIKSNGGVICGATLINSQWILTAAHCLEGNGACSLTFVLGEHDLNTNDDDALELKASSIHIHECYDSGSNSNGPIHDIALVRLEKPVVNDPVWPACVDESVPIEGTGVVVGWGVTEWPDADSTADVLHDVEVSILDECDDIHEGQFCAGEEEGGKDSCQGDSGGPLFVSDSGQQYLAGIVSHGEGCALAQSPGVYTNVTFYMDWIKATISA